MRTATRTDGRTAAAPPDDRMAKARIRDAAIACIASDGVRGTTARKVATAAGVSPGLVIHHFGSMQGLREACDAHVSAVIRDQETRILSSGTLDPLAALHDPRIPHLAAYLAAVLADDSPGTDRLVDDLIADAEAYLATGVESGALRPTGDAHARATIFVLWSLGTLVLHAHLQRHLGVDLTRPEALDGPSIARLAREHLAILGEGIYAPGFATAMRAAIDAAAATDTVTEGAPR